MSNYKPRPQNRREFLDTLVMPYDQTMGNPNEILSEPLVPGTPEVNRALQMSHKMKTLRNSLLVYKIMMKQYNTILIMLSNQLFIIMVLKYMYL
jgi:hypothetical protein